MLQAILKHIKLIIFWGVIVAVAAGGASLFLPWQYSAESQVLIISRDRSGVDPYTQAKSAERVGENLAAIMKTTDFFGKVMETTNASFDKNYWNNLSERDQRQKWQKNVESQMVYGTSLLNVRVYAKSKDEVKNFSETITQTLVSRGWEYVGGDVSLRLVNSALVSRLPARPNIAVNGLLGFVAGAVLAALWVAKYRRHHLLGV